jgi:hypothetical protein
MKCKRCNYELTRGLVVGTAIGILAMLVVVAIMFGAGCRQAKPADPQEFIDRRVPEIKRLIAECQEFHDLPRVVPLAIRFDDISDWAWMHPRYRLTIAVAHAPGVVTFDESMPQPPLPKRWVDAVCHEAVHWEQMNRVGHGPVCGGLHPRPSPVGGRGYSDGAGVCGMVGYQQLERSE